MSMSNTTENDVLKMRLQGTDPAWRAGATAYLALHTGDPGEAGTAITSECAYTSYARVAITKATAWTDGGSSFSNAALVQWPQCTGGTETVTHFSIVTTASGAGQIIDSGQLSAPLSVSNGIQPQAAIGALVVTQD
jgi:hypothetical protein